MEKTNKEYWKYYWETVLQNNKTDFLSDNYMEKFLSEIEKVEPKTAIDLGCGIGQDTKWLMDRGFDVISCDYSETALNKLKEIVPGSKTIQLDLKEKLSFEDNSAGLINANLSLHYFTMEDTIKIFKEIHRVLQPNGLLIGRVNSDKNDSYLRPNVEEIEKNYYYYVDDQIYHRFFNQEQFDVITKEWNVIALHEDVITRVGRKKALWEFVFKK